MPTSSCGMGPSYLALLSALFGLGLLRRALGAVLGPCRLSGCFLGYMLHIITIQRLDQIVKLVEGFAVDAIALCIAVQRLKRKRAREHWTQPPARITSTSRQRMKGIPYQPQVKGNTEGALG